MKTYTNLEQSIQLAKILPIESADMIFQLGEDKYADSIRVPLTKKHWEKMMPAINPCWSLAALFDILPKYIGDYNKCLYYDMGYYYCGYMIDGDFMLSISKIKADNPVDACYNMIIELKQLELL